MSSANPMSPGAPMPEPVGLLVRAGFLYCVDGGEGVIPDGEVAVCQSRSKKGAMHRRKSGPLAWNGRGALAGVLAG
jgi:hypothetical protein